MQQSEGCGVLVGKAPVHEVRVGKWLLLAAVLCPSSTRIVCPVGFGARDRHERENCSPAVDTQSVQTTVGKRMRESHVAETCARNMRSTGLHRMDSVCSS